MEIITKYKEVLRLNNHKKIWIVLSLIVLMFGAFGYGYYSALSRELNKPAEKTPIAKINSDALELPPVNGDEEGVSQFPQEDRVTPSTLLIEKIHSINTGCEIEKEAKVVPDEIVNFNEEQVKEFFKEYDSVEFSKEKITLVKNTPYLPNMYVVKLEDKYVKVFITDSEGKATLCNDFEPTPCKNKDKNLIQGVEVDSPEKVWEIIQDYD